MAPQGDVIFVIQLKRPRQNKTLFGRFLVAAAAVRSRLGKVHCSANCLYRRADLLDQQAFSYLGRLPRIARPFSGYRAVEAFAERCCDPHVVHAIALDDRRVQAIDV
ncbi:MAG TPA: hypothetical protein VFE23_10700 [Usitatibacter sp.]|jgi:hypothetical protein|nr:hypothetical protein [Usitatibacter sp.]